MSAPASARSPLATQGLGMAYAIGAIISAQFGSALAKTMMGDLGAWAPRRFCCISFSAHKFVNGRARSGLP